MSAPRKPGERRGTPAGFLLAGGLHREMFETPPRPAGSAFLDDDALYLADNGRCVCGKHAGATARASGRDISGQRLHRISESDQVVITRMSGRRASCEVCS